MLQKHYFIYKTTNTVNGKFYIGKHETMKIEAKHILWKQQVSECLDQNMQRPEILLKLNHLSSSTIDRVLRIIREEK